MSINHQEILDYLSKHYPGTSIDTEHTLAGSITIRLNTTENESSEFIDRVNEGVDRSALIWHKLFDKTGHPLWVIAYEYLEEGLIEYDPEYFFQNFPSTSSFISIEEALNTSIYDENGNETLEKAEGKIIIGKIPARDINIESILRGIANKEGGIDPIVGQSLYFLDPVNHTGFHMYDDRGFFIWANEAAKLKELYHTYTSWIPDYAKEDIDSYFR